MQIPTYEPNQVQPNTLPTPQIPTSDPVAPAIERLGQTLSGVANKQFDLAKELKYRADVSRVDKVHADFLMEYNDVMHNPQTGFLNQMGDQARGITPKGLEKVQELIGKYSGQLTDPQQQYMWQRIAKAHLPQAELNLERWESIQSKEAGIQNKKAVIKGLGENVESMVFSTSEEIAPAMNEYLYKVQELYEHSYGFGPDSDVSKQKVKDAKSGAWEKIIEQRASINPVWALKTVDEESEKGTLSPDAVTKIRTKLQPQINAYQTQNIIQQVSGMYPKTHDEPFERAKYQKEADKLTDDPKIREMVHKKIKEDESDWKDDKAQQYAVYSGNILMEARKDWNKRRQTDVTKIMRMPEFGNLPKDEQEKVLDKVDSENRTIVSGERSLLAAERSARAAESQAKAEERRAAADERRNKIEEGHKIYNHYDLNPKELSYLSKEKMGALALNMGESDWKLLANKWNKVNKPESLGFYQLEADLKNKIFQDLKISDPETQKKISQSTDEFIGTKQKESGHKLSPDEVEKAVIEGMRQVYVTQPGKLWGVNKGVPKMLMEVKEGETVEGEQPKKKGGKKIVGTKNGKNVYDLGNGKWQIGE